MGPHEARKLHIGKAQTTGQKGRSLSAKPYFGGSVSEHSSSSRPGASGMSTIVSSGFVPENTPIYDDGDGHKDVEAGDYTYIDASVHAFATPGASAEARHVRGRPRMRQ